MLPLSDLGKSGSVLTRGRIINCPLKPQIHIPHDVATADHFCDSRLTVGLVRKTSINMAEKQRYDTGLRSLPGMTFRVDIADPKERVQAYIDDFKDLRNDVSSCFLAPFLDVYVGLVLTRRSSIKG